MKTKGGEVAYLSVTQFHGKVHGWLFKHSPRESAHT